MSEPYGVSYAGLQDAEARLYQLYQTIDDISASLYQVAEQAKAAKSLENKGYVTKIRNRSLTIQELGDTIRVEGSALNQIIACYSKGEKEALQALSDIATTKAGFSEGSAELARTVSDGYQVVHSDPLENSRRDLINNARHSRAAMEAFKWWRASEGSRIVKKYLGDPGDNPALELIVKDFNSFMDTYEQVMHGVLNIKNPDARKAGINAVVGKLGLSGFAKMVPRYTNMSSAVSERAAQISSSGHPLKAVGYAFSATTLMTGQFVADGAYNTGKYVFGAFTGNVFKTSSSGSTGRKKTAWKVVEKATGKSFAHAEEELEKGMTSIGDELWSRLDGFFGL